MQLVFAGKAHPQDRGGKELIRSIIHASRDAGLRGRVVFLEDYDMRIARALVSGVDVWLNTPRRPLEASGTSGMKAASNGGLNVSVLDGWFAEAWRDHGWKSVGRWDAARSTRTRAVTRAKPSCSTICSSAKSCRSSSPATAWGDCRAMD